MRRALSLVVSLAAVGAAAVMLGRPAEAQVLSGSAVGPTGQSNVPLYAPAFVSSGASSAIVRGRVADGATAIGVKVMNLNALSTSGSKALSIYSDNGSTEVASVNRVGSLTLIGGVAAGSTVSGPVLRVSSALALGTCAAGLEGQIAWVASTGGTNSGAMTKLCLCQSDGAASPTYAWQRLNDPSLTLAGSKGNTTTCP